MESLRRQMDEIRRNIEKEVSRTQAADENKQRKERSADPESTGRYPTRSIIGTDIRCLSQKESTEPVERVTDVVNKKQLREMLAEILQEKDDDSPREEQNEFPLPTI